jgi:hypothetical protein
MPFFVLLAGCGSDPRYTTPEATFEAAKAAAAKHDYSALCDSFTPQAQEEMAAGLVMMSRFMQAWTPSQKAGGKERAVECSERLGEVLQKHGLDAPTIPKVNIHLGGSPEEQSQEVRKLVAPIKDQRAFVTDVLDVLHKYGDKPDSRLIEQSARLTGLNIDGDKATAIFVQSRNGRESSRPIVFEKMAGEWKISKTPLLVN